MATRYTDEFRRDAVRIATTSGLTQPQAASDLGVGLPAWPAMMQRITACGVSGWDEKMIDFKGVHYPMSVILHTVFFYVRYAVSYRDLEEILAERGVLVDHVTLNRWVVKFAPLIAANAHARKRSMAASWCMDENYIWMRGRWTYL